MTKKTINKVISELHKYSGANRHTGKKFLASVDTFLLKSKYPPYRIKEDIGIIVCWDYGIVKAGDDKVTISKQKKMEFYFADRQDQLLAFEQIEQAIKRFKKENNIPDYALGTVIKATPRINPITAKNI